MSLSSNDVQYIAHLARLAVEEADIARYARELSGILELVDQMSHADTARITPMAHPLDATQRLRQDKVTEPDQRELFQSVASQVEDGLYLVPRVVE